MTECMTVQRNQFRSNMSNYSVTSLLRGNRALVYKNRKMELRSTYQNKEGKGKGLSLRSIHKST